MNNQNLEIPRIALTIIEKKGKRYYLRPTIKRMRKMLRNSLKLKFKMGATTKLRVIYGKAETNQGRIENFDNKAEAKNIKDLKLVFEGFIDKDLWIPKERR